MRREKGFTLIELIVTIFILGIVLTGITQLFTGILIQFKQQSKIAETSIEGIVGLELLRRDLENGGFGLPWRISGSYNEASAGYNDSPSDPPRAFVVGSLAGWNQSDVLVIKATNVARSDAAQKWTYIDADNNPKDWNSTAEDLDSADNVIVISPGTSDANRRTLVTSSTGSVWSTTFGAMANYVPANGYNFVYGIDPDTTLTSLRMPFNRADYYIIDPSQTTTRPARCAPNASVLTKAVISQKDGSRSDLMPLLDCVADMEVVFRLDTDGDGKLDGIADQMSLNAEQIRNQVREVRVYILAHEGQKDTSYTHPEINIYVGDQSIGLGRWFNIGANVNYRWKLYTLVVKPKNLK